MNVLVTGGAGYIGSHTIVELLANGHEVVAIDNFSNSKPEVFKRLHTITENNIINYEIDLRNTLALDKIFSTHTFDTVIHFAGLKAVGESVTEPLRYYRTNIDSTLSLLETMDKHNVRRLVFSSSATVYGAATIPYTEAQTTGIGITNPYGQTKYVIEQIIKDTAASNSANEFVALRYFNPAGAHPSGLIGEDPKGIPNNLMPFIAQVASGKRSQLSIFGNDYATIDGTCVRDFIHVVDLAKGHVAAIENTKKGFDAINLGSGKGTSVLELIHAFESTTGQIIPYTIAPRREGDLPEFYANPAKALQVLNWQTVASLEDISRDTWRWQSNNPEGYTTSQ